MDKKSFLEERYCEINKLKNMLQTYPKEYCSTIIKVMESVCEDITSYLNKGKSKKDKKMRSTDNVFTKEQLSEYDGQNRNKIYIAVDGIVYDVTIRELEYEYRRIMKDCIMLNFPSAIVNSYETGQE